MHHQQVIFLLSTKTKHKLRHKNKTTSDPLKKLIEKQQRDRMTQDTVIQRVKTNPLAYDIVLFNQKIVSNLVNFVVWVIEILSVH